MAWYSRFTGPVISWVREHQFRLSYKRTKKKLEGKKLPEPKEVPFNAVLKTAGEVEKATQAIEEIGLMPYALSYKNWDSYAILSIILNNTKKDARILDAGGEMISTILPWLSLYGYEHLECINLTLKEKGLGPITYKYGDITDTGFEDEIFDVVICQSVVEHGVPLKPYFAESNRILKKGGLLITSTDYWCKKIDTMGKMAYGYPVEIYSKKEVEDMIKVAKETGFKIKGKLDLECKEPVVKWSGLEYTFIYFTLEK